MGEKFGEYEVIGKLGSGGLSDVYKAKNPSGEIVALKVLTAELSRNPTIVEKFLQELSILRRLHHPNIIRVLGNGETRHHHFLIMEFVDGFSLYALITKQGEVKEEKAVLYLHQIALALEYVHNFSIIHGDIKPQNILIKSDVVKVTDFGIATLMAEGGLSVSRSGTPTYMSPEQIRGLPLDQRTDVYSLGVTAYHMVTGICPFVGPNAHVVKTKHLNFQPVPPRRLNTDMSSELESVIMKMLEKDPVQRYQSATELIRALRSWLDPGKRCG